MAATTCHHVPLLRRRCYVVCTVAMDQLRTHVLSAFIGPGTEEPSLTFAINKRQSIRSYLIIAQCIHSGNVRQSRDPIMLSWREGLGANLVFVVDIQKARDDRGDAMRRCSLRLTLFMSKRGG